MKYDYNLLDMFSKFKIFLLSSINDFDVKINLINFYANKKNDKLGENNKSMRIIPYNYYEKLFNYKNIFKSYESEFNDKIRTEYKEKDEKQYNINSIFINNILKKYDYIPKYCLGYIKLWSSIYDLMFYENKNIFMKLLQFQSDKTIDILKINELIEKNYLIEKENEGVEEEIEEEKEKKSNYKTLEASIYIEYLKYIPLKYINYHIDEYNKLYFYYSFPLFKEILKNFIDYCQSKEKFSNSSSGIEKGTSFENILKYKFQYFKKLNVDGHLEVKSIISMDFTDNYKLLDKKYIKEKKNILITQKNQGGKDYDMAFYRPEMKSLLLIQSKYQIEHNLIMPKENYIDTSLETLNNFNLKFNEDIKKVYLLYISSVEYNIKRKATVGKSLAKNKINCLFYSVSNDLFSFDFGEKIDNLIFDDSFMILPNLNEYKVQKFKKEEEEIKKYSKIEKRYLFLNRKVGKTYNKEKIFSDFLKYFSQIGLNISLDEFDAIECSDGICTSKLKKELDSKKYIALFSLNEDGDLVINSQNPAGINYITKEKNTINLDINENKNYSSFEQLLNIFPNKYFYGIGKIK